MTFDLINPADPPARQMEKLRIIAEVLMNRVEADTDDGGAAYAQFQRAAMLEDQVRDRTRDLEHALDLLNDSNAQLARATRSAEAARQNLANAIETVQEGFALFDASDVLVLCNSRFGLHMDDIRDALTPGLTFDAYVDRVSRSRFLSLPDTESPEVWAVRRKRRHHDRHVIFNVAMLGDRWVQVSEHRTIDGGTVILQTDVTDIIRAERQARGKLLDDQARMIRATLDHIDQGVSIFDAAGRLVGWNLRLAQLLAIPVSRLRVGASFDHLLDRFRSEITISDSLTDARLMAWVTGGPGRAPLGFEVRRAGGGLILAVSAQEMPDGGFVMSFTDVTAERSAIEALSRANETLEARVMDRTLDLEDALAHAERANASRSRFVAAASHDLLQPLSAAKLFIASIQGDAIPPEAAEALHKAQNALMSVEGILDALLDISKLESGRAAVSVGQVALRPILAQLESEFAAIAAAKGLRLTVRGLDAVVMTDPAYLRRILQNLIANAIRYTDRGRVVVAARRRGAGIRLEVWDTGPGIPEDEQDNIFKEFHRLNARASASEGMGLGLAIVERACALLGHPLGLSSRLGRGTCFMVQLPRGSGAQAEMLAPSPAVASRMRLQGKIGFLVENDPDLCRAIGLLLEKWGLSVLDAASGEAALELIDELGILPDFFLVDQQLGSGMSGLEFIAACRQRHGSVPARLITSNRSADAAEAARAAGVDVMMKPMDARALEAFLRDLP
jgi:hypothetical protein